MQVFLDGDTCPRLTSLITLLSSYAVSQTICFFEGGILSFVAHHNLLDIKHLIVRLHDSLNMIIAMVDKILNPPHSMTEYLNTLSHNENEFEPLLFYTKVR